MYAQNHLAHAISRASDGRGDALFLTRHPDGGAQVSYADFWANAERMAAVLVAAGGVKPGDRVAVQAPPKTVAMLELYVGCVLAGGVFLPPLNTAYTPAEVDYFLSDARPRVFVCDPASLGALRPVADAAGGVASIFTLGAGGEVGSLIDAQTGTKPGFTAVARGEKDLAAILYTSGTTGGRSKGGAMLTHRALASNTEVLRDYWRFTADDVLIHALPIFHTHGLFVATNVTLMAGGASCIFLPGFDADAVLGYMPRATALMGGVPTFYTRLLDQEGGLGGEAAKTMRLFVSGSAPPLLTETHDRWRAVTGHAILERYGMTETNMNTSNPPYEACGARARWAFRCLGGWS